MALYPLLLEPALHVKVWGGCRLADVMNKQLPTDEPYGEAWELHDTSMIVNGPLAGRTLGDVLAEYGHDLIGPDNNPAEGIPLLIKLIDASEWLSVQVHPNDEQAHELEGDPRGKSEAWYVLAAEPGARIVVGVTPGVDHKTIAEAIRNNALESILAYAGVAAGDVLTVNANTIHALGPGILVYEVQQSSDVTYRLYDWGRVGLDGKPRELHIEKGLRVANTQSLPTIRHISSTMPTTEVVRTRYFSTLLHRLDGDQITLDTEGRCFHGLTCIRDMVVVEADSTRIEVPTGQTALIPASVGEYRLTGPARVLHSFQA